MSSSNNKSNAVEVRIKHSFDSRFTLDVDFTHTNGVLGLFGPSGSGKSTILSAVAGLLSPQESFIKIADKVVVDTKNNIWVPTQKREIGYVFQDHRLFPHLTVYKNLLYGAKIRGASRGLDFSKIVEILDLKGLLDNYPRSLSGGESQRVALGRVLLSSPKLLLMDEPMSALDSERRTILIKYLQRVFEVAGVPTLYVSHRKNEVAALAQTVITMRSGQIVEGPTCSSSWLMLTRRFFSIQEKSEAKDSEKLDQLLSAWSLLTNSQKNQLLYEVDKFFLEKSVSVSSG